MCIRDRYMGTHSQRQERHQEQEMSHSHPNAPLAENTYKSGVMGRPSHDEHFRLHPRPGKLSLLQHMGQTYDMFFQEDSQGVQFLKYTFIGAGLGVLNGLTIGMALKNNPTFAWRKAVLFARSTDFGHLKLYKELAKPYLIAGAAVGGSYYLMFHVFPPFGGHSNDGSFWTRDILGHAIFGSIWSAILWNPVYWWAGFWFGGFAGFGWATAFKGNYFSNKSSPLGYTVQLPGLTEDEIKKQEYKDYIENLGMFQGYKNHNIQSISQCCVCVFFILRHLDVPGLLFDFCYTKRAASHGQITQYLSLIHI
eukprot:TRINITY_DN1251_c0_g3_i5.p1 TRINITY_DN1251_c0_g3~~TRINITY_DN1251_c0_g3_i5.p1  ORF type:complete len:343 (-),score=82.97 TRINITY_DN1251_c0_g3_i5:61-984(-)